VISNQFKENLPRSTSREGCFNTTVELTCTAVVGLPARLGKSRWLVKYLYFTVDTITQLSFSDFKVITNLQPQPDRRTCTKVTRQAHGGIYGNCTLTIHNLADTNRCNADIVRQTILTQAERFHEVLEQNFARMNWGKQIIHSFYLYE